MTKPFLKNFRDENFEKSKEWLFIYGSFPFLARKKKICGSFKLGSFKNSMKFVDNLDFCV